MNGPVGSDAHASVRSPPPLVGTTGHNLSLESRPKDYRLLEALSFFISAPGASVFSALGATTISSTYFNVFEKKNSFCGVLSKVYMHKVPISF